MQQLAVLLHLSPEIVKARLCPNTLTLEHFLLQITFSEKEANEMKYTILLSCRSDVVDDGLPLSPFSSAAGALSKLSHVSQGQVV